MDTAALFFDGWTSIARTVVVGTLAYAALIVLLRISGKRTLAKLNAFDLVVTVAIGSTLASVLLSSDVALAQGVAALLTLVALQYAVAALSVRSRRFARLVRSEPTLLVRDGEVLRGALARARITEDELMSVIRASDHPDPARIAAVILESDGAFSVIGVGTTDYASRDIVAPA